MCHDPVKHKRPHLSASRSRDPRKIYDEYEKICVKSGMYIADPTANYTLVRLDDTTQVITEIFLPEFLRRTGLKGDLSSADEQIYCKCCGN